MIAVTVFTAQVFIFWLTENNGCNGINKIFKKYFDY